MRCPLRPTLANCARDRNVTGSLGCGYRSVVVRSYLPQSDGSCRSALSSWRIAVHALLNLRHASRHLGLREVPVAVVRRFELATVDRDLCSLQQPPIVRHRATNRAHTLRIAAPLSFRKSAIVLWSGASRPSSHMTSTLRPASRSSRRLDLTRLR